MSQVTVRKLDHTGQEVFSYPGRVLQRDGSAIALRTFWDRASLDIGYVVLEPGDRWTERFYADRWYNIFEIRADSGRLKGWYCNVTRPARITASEVTAEDLALDLWVAPNGDMLTLDEDEFAELPLSSTERERARHALVELQTQVAQRVPPFDQVCDDE
jgi:hypothetical protein